MVDTIEIENRIAKCEKLLSVDPKSQIFAALAEAFRKKGNLKKAQEVCLQGLKIHPDYAAARVVLAKIYMTKENYDLAREELIKAISASGRSRSIDMLEAEILLRKGHRAAAAPILERLYLSDPENENVKSLLELMNEIKDTNTHESYGLTAGMLRSTPNYDNGTMTLGDFLGIIKVFPKVTGVMAVGLNGLVLESRLGLSLPKEETAAISKVILDGIMAASSKIYLGRTREVLIETSDSKIWIFVEEKYSLIIFAKSDVGLGALKLKVEKMLKDVQYQNEGD